MHSMSGEPPPTLILRDLRELAGLSIDALAAKLRVSKAEVLAMEAGRGDPGHVDAAQRRLLEGEDIHGRLFFFQGPAASLRWHHDVPLFRASLLEARKRLANNPGALTALERRIALRPTPVRGDAYGAAARQGYLLARRARQALGLGPAAALGDWWTRLDERLAVHVLAPYLQCGARAAAILDQQRSAAVIFINAADPRTLQPPHFSYATAHELCHLLFDAPPGARDGVQISVDEHPEGGSRGQLVEARANGFAAELLLPRAGLIDLLGPPPADPSTTRFEEAESHGLKACRHFGASAQVTINHLHNCGYYDDDTRADLISDYRTGRSPWISDDTKAAVGLAPSHSTDSHVSDPIFLAQQTHALGERVRTEQDRARDTAIQSTLDQAQGQGETRAAVTLARWSIDRLRAGQVDWVSELLFAFSPATFAPATSLGLLSVLLTQRAEVEESWFSLVQRTRAHLEGRLGWDEARIASAMKGLLA